VLNVSNHRRNGHETTANGIEKKYFRKKTVHFCSYDERFFWPKKLRDPDRTCRMPQLGKHGRAVSKSPEMQKAAH